MSHTAADQALGKRWFRFAVLLELLLVGVGLALSVLFNLPLTAAVRWNPWDALWGALAVGPMLVLLGGIVHSHWRPIKEIPQFLDATVRPIMEQWSLLQLGLISVLAGIGEELLFRGVIQTGLGQWLNPWFGLTSASVLFGVCHWVNPGYGIIATVIGAYLGFLFTWSANLLVPVVAHAVYDFVALIYFIRIRVVEER